MDRSIFVQYTDFLLGVGRLDLGVSVLTRRPVVQEIGDQMWHTFALGTASMVVAVVIGVPLGVMSAVRRNSALDQGLRIVALFGICMPQFWIGLLALWLFALILGWFPIMGAGRSSNPIDYLWHLILPAFTCGYGNSALIMRMTRSCMLEVISQEYIRTARAKGLAERVVVYRHALRNALIPVVTIVGLNIGWLLGGAVVVETVFARPGLGKLLVDAMFTRDYAQAQASLIIFGLTFMIGNLLADLTYGLADPRIRYG
jgi:ABC-type dipeptide/oligopeptide/nickel transport system permease component